MNEKTIQEIMSDLKAKDPSEEQTHGTPLTIWISMKDKERYERLQKLSGRKLSKKVREVIQAVLDYAEKQVS